MPWKARTGLTKKAYRTATTCENYTRDPGTLLITFRSRGHLTQTKLHETMSLLILPADLPPLISSASQTQSTAATPRVSGHRLIDCDKSVGFTSFATRKFRLPHPIWAGIDDTRFVPPDELHCCRRGVSVLHPGISCVIWLLKKLHFLSTNGVWFVYITTASCSFTYVYSRRLFSAS